jgi:hypothetical protein
MKDVKERFDLLKRQLGKEIKAIDEVYINHSQNNLIYYPIEDLNFEELLEKRNNLQKSGLKLLGATIFLNKVSQYHPQKKSQKGCFPSLEWLSSEFLSEGIPRDLVDRQDFLEKDSGWKVGGPGEK